MSEVKYLLAYLTLLVYFITIGLLGGPYLVYSELGSISPPTCDIGGWDALVDVATCIWDNLNFFFGLISVSTTLQIFTLVILVLSAVTLYVVLRLIRGGG